MICLGALGQTINVMTLGGLALAVGILVDDATVEIENIHRNLAMGKDLLQAILDGASQIAVPAFVSSLSICIVFVPIFFLSGPAASLFRPLAMAVIFAMLASYLLSRTLVPTMALHLLEKEKDLHQGEDRSRSDCRPAGTGSSTCTWSAASSDSATAITPRCVVPWSIECRCSSSPSRFVVLSAMFVPFIGQDFFPHGRRRPAPPARARRGRNATSRRRSVIFGAGRARDPSGDPAERHRSSCSTTSA